MGLNPFLLVPCLPPPPHPLRSAVQHKLQIPFLSASPLSFLFISQSGEFKVSGSAALLRWWWALSRSPPFLFPLLYFLSVSFCPLISLLALHPNSHLTLLTYLSYTLIYTSITPCIVFLIAAPLILTHPLTFIGRCPLHHILFFYESLKIIFCFLSVFSGQLISV